MSTPFLKQVAKKYIGGDDPSAISKLCLVFPNRRSIAFFRKYLAEAVMESAGKPVVLPYLVTVNDFFEKLSGKTIEAKVPLLLDLYDCYKALAPKAEPLDEFIFWGDVILSDFGDVDRYMVDAEDLFTNISDLREIDGGFEYLSDTQKEAMRRFLDHFDPSRRKTSSSLKGRGNVKESFATMWSLLYPLYRSFREKLAAKGAAYSGMAYREVAERLSEEAAADILKPVYPHADKFVFVGLNALSESEKALMASMKKAAIADFCWDYMGELIKDKDNFSSRFMDANISLFGQSIDLEKESGRDFEVNVVKVPSAIGQVKHIPGIIKGLDPEKTAIVLPDEGLLPSLLNTIPEDIRNINVTMGYPVTSSEFHTFISTLLALQIHQRKYSDGHIAFYHKQVSSIFASGIMRQVIEVEDNPELESRIRDIKDSAKFYVPESDFGDDRLLKTIFRSVITDMSAPSAQSVRDLCAYLKDVITTVAPSLKKIQRSGLELDFAKRYYNDINVLECYNLEITPASFARLLSQVAGVESVPFNGEPLKGLQIMGPLETRALDFDNVVILSMNEGIFPSHNVSSSFIPAELRKGFGLPTYELQDSVWAYYFYRMTTRAKKLWMLYDTRTEGVETGEESRFIKQLRYLYNVPLNEMTSGVSVSGREANVPSLSKTDEDMKAIGAIRFSPSSFKTLAECPLEFCYKYVKKLKAPGEVKESLDGGASGTVFHALAQSIYHSEGAVLSPEPTEIYMKKHPKGEEYISKEYLRGWEKRDKDLRAKIEVEIKHLMKVSEIRGKDLLMEEVILRYVRKLIESDIRILENNSRTRFHILSLERDYPGVCIGGFAFHGVIDRLDTFDDGTLRVVDYKTGGDSSRTIAATRSYSAPDKAEELVNGTDKDHYKNAALLQFYLYDRFVMEEYKVGPEAIRNTMYSAADMFKETPSISGLNPGFLPTMDAAVEAKLADLADPMNPFVAGACRTANYKEEDNCKYCDFKKICGK